MKTKIIIVIVMLSVLSIIFSKAIYSQTRIQDFAPKPPLGFNTYDSYRGGKLNEKIVYELLDVMAEKYLPYGYEYFVIDGGWYDGINTAEQQSLDADAFGLYMASPEDFPNGMKGLIAYAHKKGLKFGLWLLRGIPRGAVKNNLSIPGTEYTARDIADTNNICGWNNRNYGVDMSKPGAQIYYNTIIDSMASWGVDFIKYDDIVPNPEEIIAVADAIEQGGHKIVFSLSPGDVHHLTHLPYYKRANMLRITGDVWDNPWSLQKSFIAWDRFQTITGPGFWLDLDMIPFGRLDVMNERARQSKFNHEQMKTFITQRALAASPLIIGGDLLTMDDFSYSLLTNQNMLACNQNGVTGVNVYRAGTTEVWLTPDKTDPRKGWIGIFNRTTTDIEITLTKQDLGFIAYERSYNLTASGKSFQLTNIWSNKTFDMDNKHTFILPAEGVAFYKFQEK